MLWLTAAWSAYALALWVGQALIGPVVGALALLPVMASGLLLGRRAGIASGLVAAVATRALLRLRGDVLVADLTEALVAYAVLVAVGWAVGWLGETARDARRQRDRLGEEARQRAAAEDGLRSTLAHHEATLEQLRRSEARWRSLAENAPAFIVTCDAAGRITFVNRTPEGLAAEAVLGRRAWELATGPEGAAKARAAIERVLRDGRPLLMEEEGPGPGGRPSVYAVHWSPIKDAQGEVTGCTGMAFDVTEERADQRRQEAARARTEAQLRESREVLEQSNDGFYVCDAASGRILDVTRRSCIDTGYTRDELLAMHVMDLDVLVPDLAAWRAKVERVAHGRSVLETQLRRKDGSLVPVEVSIRLVPGEPARTVAILRDITARKQAEASAREAEAAHQAAALKTQFLSNAAHELATPLTPLRLQLATLRARTDHSPNDREALELLDRNVRRLGTLVGDLLDAARLQSGRLRLRLTEVDVAAVASHALESFRAQARLRGVTLGLHAPAGLRVHCDETRLEQVLFNLLHNAIKFTPAGGQVWVVAQADDAGVAVEVRDTGIGLSAQQSARLFQPFTQVHDPSQVKAGGTGLGLYIARSIAQQHGGDIAVASAGPGAGACFRLRLPLRPALAAAGGPATATALPAVAVAPGAR